MVWRRPRMAHSTRTLTLIWLFCGILCIISFGEIQLGWMPKLPAEIKNGRYAFFLLKNFLIAFQYVTNMDAQLELKLHIFSYDGYKIGFTFQKFVNFHKGKTYDLWWIDGIWIQWSWRQHQGTYAHEWNQYQRSQWLQGSHSSSPRYSRRLWHFSEEFPWLYCHDHISSE